MRRPHLPRLTDRLIRRVVLAAMLLTLAVVIGLLVLVLKLSDDLDEKTGIADAANERLVEEGLPPVTPSDGEPGEPGEPGEQGTQGDPGRAPSASEIGDAVAAYCEPSNCRGPAGRGVTRAEVALAVSAFCDARGQCRGPRGIGIDGTDGTDGHNGVDGAQGQQGPPPSDAQVAAAVAAFCADGRCKGQPGADGAPGPTCPDGFTPEQRTIITDGGPESAVVCVAG